MLIHYWCRLCPDASHREVSLWTMRSDRHTDRSLMIKLPLWVRLYPFAFFEVVYTVFLLHFGFKRLKQKAKFLSIFSIEDVVGSLLIWFAYAFASCDVDFVDSQLCPILACMMSALFVSLCVTCRSKVGWLMFLPKTFGHEVYFWSWNLLEVIFVLHGIYVETSSEKRAYNST